MVGDRRKGKEGKANDDANLKVEVKLSDPARKRTDVSGLTGPSEQARGYHRDSGQRLTIGSLMLQSEYIDGMYFLNVETAHLPFFTPSS